MKTVWRYDETVYEGEEYKINGINIWDFKWEETGEKIRVKDPVYGQFYSFDVYKIQNNLDVLFAAGEFSNCVYGIYRREENVPRKFSLDD
jgi:hypothetical protein